MDLQGQRHSRKQEQRNAFSQQKIHTSITVSQRRLSHALMGVSRPATRLSSAQHLQLSGISVKGDRERLHSSLWM